MFTIIMPHLFAVSFCRVCSGTYPGLQICYLFYDGLILFFTTVYGGDNPVVYRNNGYWNFSNETSDVGLGGLPSTYQAAWADIDNDGDLDLATAGNIYRNNGLGNNYLKVRLEGDGINVNRSAIGAQVRATYNWMEATRQVEGGMGEGNQNDLVLHFGLGSYTESVSLEVFWPDGMTETLSVMPNQLVTISRIETGDFNEDGVVDPADFAILSANWLFSVSGGVSEGDANGDGVVDPADFALMAGNWLAGVGGMAAASSEPEVSTILATAVSEGSVVAGSPVGVFSPIETSSEQLGSAEAWGFPEVPRFSRGLDFWDARQRASETLATAMLGEEGCQSSEGSVVAEEPVWEGVGLAAVQGSVGHRLGSEAEMVGPRMGRHNGLATEAELSLVWSAEEELLGSDGGQWPSELGCREEVPRL